MVHKSVPLHNLFYFSGHRLVLPLHFIYFSVPDLSPVGCTSQSLKYHLSCNSGNPNITLNRHFYLCSSPLNILAL
jgi:hypothetical protein